MSNIAKQAKQEWHALDVELEPDAREAVEYALMEAGALGTETNGDESGLLQVTGYFPAPPGRERVRAELLDALRTYNLPSSSIRDMTVRQVPYRDWLAEWKRNWKPIETGRFIIAPPWSQVDESRTVIRIEPGMAFGTGTHETTQLCLAALERFFRGTSFLDVGTGTGILAIAAAKLFPEAYVQACDIDEDAIRIAKQNAVANNVETRIDFHVGTVDDTTPSADLVCANLTVDAIIPLLPTLLNLTCGRLVLSGILDSQLESLAEQLQQYGVSEFQVEQNGEWVAVVV
jgi:ribosomal protein L11 methyltransferase